MISSTMKTNHVLYPYPAFGKLRLGTKADLLSSLEDCTQSATPQPDAEIMILDGVFLHSARRYFTYKNTISDATQNFDIRSTFSNLLL